MTPMNEPLPPGDDALAFRRTLLCMLGIAVLAPLWKVTNGWVLLPCVLLAFAALHFALALRAAAREQQRLAAPAARRDTE